MKRAYIIIATAAAALLSLSNASAQTFQTGYFLENYTFSYQLNPASQPTDTKGFVGIGIDNISVGANANVGLSSFFFPGTVDGKKALLNGFNEQVSAETFLGALNDNNKANVNAAVNVLSFGFRGKRQSNFWTFELNVKANASANAPKDLFSALKLGATAPANYNAGGTWFNTTDYVEAALGFSHRFNRNISFGARFKALVGVSDIAINLNDFNISANEQISVNANGDLDIHAVGLTFPKDAEGNYDFDVDGDEKIGPAGFGAAFDMGLEVRFPNAEGLTFSAALLDLGGLSWNNGNLGKAAFNGTIGDESSLNIEELFTPGENGVSEFKMLSPTLNLGLKYQLAKKLNVGAFATARTGRYSNYEARLGASFNAGKVLSLAGSAGINTCGACFGAALSLKIPGINFYIGTDSVIAQFTPEWIPVNKLNTRINLGLVIAF